MSLKHLGGVLTPGQEFVCFRCRVGWSRLNTRHARRNVQTESQSPQSTLDDVTRTVPGSISNSSKAPKSTPGASVLSRRTKRYKLKRPTFPFPVPKVAKHSQNKDVQVNSQVATDVLHLEQRFRDARRITAHEFHKRQQERTRLFDALETPPKEPSSISKRAHHKSDLLKKKAQDASQDQLKAIKTKKKFAKSSKLAVKTKASDDVQETEVEAVKTNASDDVQESEAKAARNKEEDPMSKILIVEIKTTKKVRKNKKTALQATGSTPTGGGEILNDNLSDDDEVVKVETRSNTPQVTAMVEKTKEAPANVKPRKVKSRKVKSRKVISRKVISRKVISRKVISATKSIVKPIRNTLIRKVLCHDVGADKPQDGATAPIRKPNQRLVRRFSVVRAGLESLRPWGKERVRLPMKAKVDGSPKGDANHFENSKFIVQTVKAEELQIAPLEIEQAPVPSLSYGLDRVLFNPGVYHLQDRRSRVFNFDPYLQTIMPVAEFDFAALRAYVTSSKDQSLKDIAEKHGKRYMGSSSSMTSVLAHFHFLLSRFRKVNVDMLSKGFPDRSLRSFTLFQRSPTAVFLKWRDGSYAIDADKQFDSATILSLLGKAMEKLLTLDTDDYERYRKSNPDQVSVAERDASETFHYSTMGDILMRSQLDAHDYRLPGTGMFDLKTRAVVSIRMDAQNHQNGVGYEIKSSQGEWESYEREYFDMIRSAFLKYSLQVRMGRMDGIFVAFHNVERIFGFQYISLPEMDLALHGKLDTTIGDEEFKLSLGLLNKVLDHATEKYPETSLRIHFEAREGKATFMYIFVEPVTEDQAEEIQSTNVAKIREFERTMLGYPTDEPPKPPGQEEQCNDWAKIEASVKEAMHTDELSLTNLTTGNEPSLLPMDSYDHNKNPGTLEDNVQIENSDDAHNPTAALEDDVKIEISDHGHNSTMVLEDDVQIESSDDVHNPTAVVDGLPGIENSQEPDEATLPSGPAEVDFDVSADAPYLESVAQSLSAIPTGEVCAWTLSIRNKVNGVYIDRPEELTSTDKWEVDYSLTEVTNPQRARMLYQACQLRRRNQAEKEPELRGQDSFLEMLRKLSRLGVDWRKALDEADKGKPRLTLTPTMVTKDQHEGGEA